MARNHVRHPTARTTDTVSAIFIFIPSPQLWVVMLFQKPNLPDRERLAREFTLKINRHYTDIRK